MKIIINIVLIGAIEFVCYLMVVLRLVKLLSVVLIGLMKHYTVFWWERSAPNNTFVHWRYTDTAVDCKVLFLLVDRDGISGLSEPMGEGPEWAYPCNYGMLVV